MVARAAGLDPSWSTDLCISKVAAKKVSGGLRTELWLVKLFDLAARVKDLSYMEEGTQS